MPRLLSITQSPEYLNRAQPTSQQIPAEFYCKVTKKLLFDPVFVSGAIGGHGAVIERHTALGMVRAGRIRETQIRSDNELRRRIDAHPVAGPEAAARRRHYELTGEENCLDRYGITPGPARPTTQSSTPTPPPSDARRAPSSRRSGRRPEGPEQYMPSGPAIGPMQQQTAQLILEEMFKWNRRCSRPLEAREFPDVRTWPELSEDEARYILVYLRRLFTIPRAQHTASCRHLADALFQVLGLMHRDAQRREPMIRTMVDGIVTCEDRVAFAFNKLYETYEIAKAGIEVDGSADSRCRLQNLARSFVRLRAIEDAAQRCVDALERQLADDVGSRYASLPPSQRDLIFAHQRQAIDPVEIQLFFISYWHAELELPTPIAEQMWSCEIIDEILAEAGPAALRASDDAGKVEEQLRQWDNIWPQQLRLEESLRLPYETIPQERVSAAQLAEAVFPLSPDVDDWHDMAKPVYLMRGSRPQFFEHEDFINWWKQHRTDLDNVETSLNDLRRP